MIRKQIRLPEEEHEELKKAASALGRSMSDCIREGIQLFLGRFRRRADEIEGIAGKFSPLPGTELKPHDRWLADAVIDSKSTSPQG